MRGEKTPKPGVMSFPTQMQVGLNVCLPSAVFLQGWERAWEWKKYLPSPPNTEECGDDDTKRWMGGQKVIQLHCNSPECQSWQERSHCITEARSAPLDLFALLEDKPWRGLPLFLFFYQANELAEGILLRYSWREIMQGDRNDIHQSIGLVHITALLPISLSHRTNIP